MEHHPQQLGPDGELWIRCVFCGDSTTHPNRCHFSVNLRTGLYYCYRCHSKGKLTVVQLLSLITQMGIQQVFGEEDQGIVKSSSEQPVLEEELPELIPGAAISRYSRLERFHLRRWPQGKGRGGPGILYDAFQIRDPLDDSVTGIYLRRASSKKESRIIGGSGFGWVGDSFPLSFQHLPLRLVEGPYDVIYYCDVCTFGMVTQGLRDLRGHSIVLCPDGDVWQEPSLFIPFMKQLDQLLWSTKMMPYLVGIEVLPDGKDPDEVPAGEREFIPRSLLIRSRLAKKNKRRIQFIQGLLS